MLRRCRRAHRARSRAMADDMTGLRISTDERMAPKRRQSGQCRRSAGLMIVGSVTVQRTAPRNARIVATTTGSRAPSANAGGGSAPVTCMADAQRTVDRAAAPALAGVIVGRTPASALLTAEDLAGCCSRRRYAGDQEAREDDVEDKRVRCDKRRRPAHTLPENEPPHLIPRFTRITARAASRKIARRRIPSIAQQCCATAI